MFPRFLHILSMKKITINFIFLLLFILGSFLSKEEVSLESWGSCSNMEHLGSCPLGEKVWPVQSRGGLDANGSQGACRAGGPSPLSDLGWEETRRGSWGSEEVPVVRLLWGWVNANLLCYLDCSCDWLGPGSTSGAYSIRAADVREWGWLGQHCGKLHMLALSQGGTTATMLVLGV